MAAILKIFTNEEFHDLAVVERGAQLILGRSVDVDISVPEDPKISSNHLKIRSAGGQFEIEDLGSTNGTFLKTEQVTKVILEFGEVFRCGGTDFVFVPKSEQSAHSTMADSGSVAAAPPEAAPAAAQPPEKSTPPASAEETPQAVADAPGFCEETALAVMNRFELAKEIPFAPEEGESPADFVTKLANSDEPNHCLLFMSYALEKRSAVWWLTRCVQEVESILDDNDREMLSLAEQWVAAPSDANRRKAMESAEALEMSTPAAWAGVGAFWSGGSMAPPEAPAVEPADNLAGKAISGGAIMASVFHAPEKALDKQKSFTQLGVDVAAGKIPWE